MKTVFEAVVLPYNKSLYHQKGTATRRLQFGMKEEKITDIVLDLLTDLMQRIRNIDTEYKVDIEHTKHPYLMCPVRRKQLSPNDVAQDILDRVDKFKSRKPGRTIHWSYGEIEPLNGLVSIIYDCYLAKKQIETSTEALDFFNNYQIAFLLAQDGGRCEIKLPQPKRVYHTIDRQVHPLRFTKQEILFRDPDEWQRVW